jgi:hypothetical protein
MLTMVLLGSCGGGPEPESQLDRDVSAFKERVSQGRKERDSYAKGTAVHDVIALRVAMDEQTLAMLEQKRAAGKSQVALTYTVSGRSYTPPGDAQGRIAALEKRIDSTRKGRESDLEQIKSSGEAVRPLYVLSAATKSVQISQLEYQVAAYRHGFPPYSVPSGTPPAAGKSRPQVVEAPARKKSTPAPAGKSRPQEVELQPGQTIEVPAGKTVIVR